MVDTTQSHNNHFQPGPETLRNKCFQLLAAMVIFISGLVAGVSITIFLIKNKVVWREPLPVKPTAFAIAHEIQERFDLSDEQTKKVEEIFETAVKSVSTIRENSSLQMEASKKETIEQMRQVLTKQQFNAWLEDFRQRFNRGPGFGHGPGFEHGPEHDFRDGPPPPPPDPERQRLPY